MAKKENHICFFNSHEEWGGGEKWHSETAFHLYKKKQAVVLIAHKHGRLIKKMQYSMPVMSVLLSNLSFLNPIAYIRLIRIFKQYNVKTIVLCLPIDVKVAGLAAKIAGVKNIIYRRGSAIPIKNSVYNRFLFSRVITNVIANSEATKNTILQNNEKLISRDKITVLYNGIDIPPIPLKVENEKIIIAAAGRLEPQKNFLQLVDIAKKLKENNCDFEIQIAGKGSEKELLKDKIKEYSLKKHIKLVGFQSDLGDFLKQADIFVLTSHWEGFGFVLAEAMVQTLPIVAYNVSSNPELVENNVNGFLVEYNNELEFSQKLVELINNKELRISMGEKGREIVEHKFSAQKSHAKVEEFLLQLHNN